MTYMLALLLAPVLISRRAEVTLQPGTNELQVVSRSGKQIVLRVDVASPGQEHCASWRWGAEAECPRLSVAALEVLVNNESLFVPRSAFADLGYPHRASIVVRPRGFDVVVRGGDAAGSHAAKLRFSYSEIKSRRVENGGFPDSAWEATKFSFTK